MQFENNLIYETSPYLLQHAHNPVNWHAWNENTLKLACKMHKPILLSIGYAACHWCHVMAHESFEDLETADLMNKYFINIKVDREERPDVDKIYQTTHYLLMQQSGGWPLTVFLMPDTLIPFFSGTYFPNEDKYQLPAFKKILLLINDIFHNQKEQIKIQNAQVFKILSTISPPQLSLNLDLSVNQKAIKFFEKDFDSINGGFGHAPKFPQVPKLEFLIQMQSNMASKTMEKMIKGGIYDQLGGGFFRYTVDENWQIPHFEKMLYDNAQLINLYHYDKKYQIILNETINWLIDNMQSKEGGFFSSIDADSEGGEGLYYLWDYHEIKIILSPKELKILTAYYNLTNSNFANKLHHFYIAKSITELSQQFQISVHTVTEIIKSAKNKLLKVRNMRILPQVDTKILTSWNALAIKALANVSITYKNNTYYELAVRAFNFIHQNMWKNSKLYASYSLGAANLTAYLDDYAFMIDAILSLLQIEWNNEWFDFAIELMNSVIEKFYDSQNHGFYFVSSTHEKLLYRPKSLTDEITSSGNSIAIQMLIVLGYLLGETKYLDIAEQTLKAFYKDLTTYPTDHASLLWALNLFLNPPTIIVIRGAQESIYTWRDACKNNKNYVFPIPNHIHLTYLNTQSSNVATTAYVCKGLKCLNAITSLEELLKETRER